MSAFRNTIPVQLGQKSRTRSSWVILQVHYADSIENVPFGDWGYVSIALLDLEHAIYLFNTLKRIQMDCPGFH